LQALPTLAEAAGLYYEMHGPEDAPPLILSSGMGGSASYWKPNIPALSRHFRVIAYDHRGTGRSDRTVTPRIQSIGDDIRLLMDELDLRSASVAGHAIGGMGALWLALEAPERIARLVVINGWGEPNPYTMRCFDARLSLLRKCSVEEYIYAQPLFLYPPNWTHDHHVELEDEEGGIVADFPVEMIDARILEAVRFCLCPSCNDRPLTVPTLFLASADDALVPPTCSDSLVVRYPGSKSALMNWGGHACNVTDPKTFNRLVLDFLRS
jgi:aminoacrylate hydrolase